MRMFVITVMNMLVWLVVNGDDGGNCSSHDADEDGVVDGGGCENGGEGGKVE